jgi:hypothetical protein
LNEFLVLLIWLDERIFCAISDESLSFNRLIDKFKFPSFLSPLGTDEPIPLKNYFYAVMLDDFLKKLRPDNCISAELMQ